MELIFILYFIVLIIYILYPTPYFVEFRYEKFEIDDNTLKNF